MQSSPLVREINDVELLISEEQLLSTMVVQLTALTMVQQHANFPHGADFEEYARALLKFLHIDRIRPYFSEEQKVFSANVDIKEPLETTALAVVIPNRAATSIEDYLSHITFYCSQDKELNCFCPVKFNPVYKRFTFIDESQAGCLERDDFDVTTTTIFVKSNEDADTFMDRHLNYDYQQRIIKTIFEDVPYVHSEDRLVPLAAQILKLTCEETGETIRTIVTNMDGVLKLHRCYVDDMFRVRFTEKHMWSAKEVSTEEARMASINNTYQINGKKFKVVQSYIAS